MSRDQGDLAAVRGRVRPRGTPRWDTLAATLTGRDRWILRMLAEHRVLTTTRLTALAFPSIRAAQIRLRTLNELGVIAGFRPLVRHGSTPYHWVLDTTGATVLAAEDGIDPPTGAEGRRAHRLAIAHSNQLQHLLGVNTALTTLAATPTTPTDPAQGDIGGRLVVWWSAARCATATGDHVRPDAYARWNPNTPAPNNNRHPLGSVSTGSEINGRTDRLPDTDAGVGFWFEYDTGTERLAQLAGKLFGYHDLAAATATVIPILFWLPTPTREANARTALATVAAGLAQPHLVPIATTHPITTPHGDSHAGESQPALTGCVWAPLHTTTAEPHGSSNTVARRVSIGVLDQCWPRLADPRDAEATVLAAAYQPDIRREPRPRSAGSTTVRRQATSSWSSRLTPPTPTPPNLW